MHILLSNDDGIHAAGLRALAEACVSAGHRVTICAPDRERSASGHALTMRDPLYAERVDYDGIDAWAISGTPVDCVRLGLLSLAQGPVDLVASGINHGPNLGTDTLYSGTVAAAMEALVLDHAALAVSLCSKHKMEHMESAARWACRVIAGMAARGLDRTHLYNLNVPALPFDEVKGVRMARLSRKRYTNGYEKLTSPYGRDHYWLDSWPEEVGEEPGSDEALTRAGYATLTPLTWSLMDESALTGLEGEW